MGMQEGFSPSLTHWQVSVDEFHGHLDCRPTKFSERVFAILDQDMSGLLDFREFVVGVWNYCTYDTVLLTKVLGTANAPFIECPSLLAGRTCLVISFSHCCVLQKCSETYSLDEIYSAERNATHLRRRVRVRSLMREDEWWCLLKRVFTRQS